MVKPILKIEVGTKAVSNRTRPLLAKDGYGRFHCDAAVEASARLAACSSTEYLE